MPSVEVSVWCVTVLRHWDSLAAGPWTIAGMTGAPGCIGFMPIFETRTQAGVWRDENAPTATIAEMASRGEVVHG